MAARTSRGNSAAATAPANNIPIITTSQRRFGMRPASAGALYAGLEVAPGNDLGRFFLGGTITGIVDVPGSMETFYAGNVLTGDAGGLGNLQDPATDPIWPDKNFNVGGDIRNLVSANGFGTLSLTGAVLENIVYKTGFKLNVGGKVGQVLAADSFLGEAVVQNKPTVRGPGIVQREVEVRGANLPTPGDSSYFDPTFFGNNIGIGGKSFDARFFNDTFDTAQFLGVAFSRTLSSDQSILLNGALGNFGSGNGSTPDLVDYYALPLLAGQTVQIQLTDTTPIQRNQNNLPAHLGIFDPYGKLLQTDYSSRLTKTRTGEAIQITATVAGAYRIAVATNGDTNFSGTVDAGESITFRQPNPYQLKITNAGNLAFGGLIARAELATADAGNRGIEVDSGDIGAVEVSSATGNIFSFSNPWYIPAGNLRSVVASSLGILRSTPAETVVIGSGPDFRVRKGSIGLLRAFNTSLTTGILMVNDDVDAGVFPSPTADLRTISSTLGVGRSIQLVDAAGNLEGDLLSNGSIGVIRADRRRDRDGGARVCIAAARAGVGRQC